MTSINKKGQGDPAFENGDGDLKVRMLHSFFNTIRVLFTYSSFLTQYTKHAILFWSKY